MANQVSTPSSVPHFQVHAAHSSKTEGNPAESRSHALYMDLMKRTLVNLIYGHAEVNWSKPKEKMRAFVWKHANRILRKFHLMAGQPIPAVPENRINGVDWPPFAHAMTGTKRLDNLQLCVENVVKDKVEGDFIETGVWRGGATIFMRACLKSLGDDSRIVWAADSFEGLPKPNAEKYPADEGDEHFTANELAVSIDDVKNNFEAYGMLDDQVQFLKGWFCDTLPSAPIEKLAILRLDGDMYESTMDALNSLYSKLEIGGYCIVDDYGAVEGCKLAVDDFRKEHGINDPIHEIDWTGVYWRRGS